MERLVQIMTFDQDCIELKVINPKGFNLEFIKDFIERLTNIIGPHQLYFHHGKEVQSLQFSDLPLNSPLEMVENNTLSVLRILIQFHGRAYPVYVSNYEKKYLLCLKLAIEKKMQFLGIECPFDSQSLKINGQELPASFNLSDLSYNTKIDLDLNTFIPQRHAITTYEIRDIIEGHKERKNALFSVGAKFEVKVDERAAKWRLVQKGFSIQCYCRNRECEARNRTVVVNLGFGIFTIESLRDKVVCPICGEISQEYLTAGFFFAAWKFKGIIEEHDVCGEDRTWNQYSLWRALFDSWDSLKFCVRPNASSS